MNILIIGKPRSRTTYLGKSISSYYNTRYLSEPYDSAGYMHNHYYRLKMKKSNNYESLLYQKQEEWLYGVTKNIFEINNCVAKIFPRHLTVDISGLENYKLHDNYDSRWDSFTDPNNFKFKLFTNLSEILQLKKFDKLFFIERNLIDSPISFAYSMRINHFVFNSHQNIDQVKKKFSQILLDEKDIPFINYVVYEHVLLEKIKAFIAENYPCVFVTYENVTDYVETNFKVNLKNNLINPKFNYKEIIKNYTEMEKYINQVYKIFCPKLENIIFT